MEKLYPQPYKLFNKIQHYAWGTKNNEAFIPKFLGNEPEQNTPYAELWIGAHPKASSEIEIDGEKLPLNKLIKQNPADWLGNYVSQKFSNNFPFLLKVLSAAHALSIQTHPNKPQAAKLHSVDPKNYPDDNHKPEIAIAIDSLMALAGFRPVNEIINNLLSIPEICEFAESEIPETILNSLNNEEAEKTIRNIYSKLMRRTENNEKLSFIIQRIIERLEKMTSLPLEGSQFLKQFDLFGNDIGLFSFFFFNIIELKPGEAIFTDAGIPHAYIKGNIIECMANSDNVVRAGLTNKFKDINTLLGIINYDFSPYKIINPNMKNGDTIYLTKAEEFEVSNIKYNDEFNKLYKTINKPEIILIANGELNIAWTIGENTSKQKFSKGESFIIPANMNEYQISSSGNVNFYRVTIP